MELCGKKTECLSSLQLAGACYKAVRATQLLQKGQRSFAIAITDQVEYAAPHSLHIQVQFALLSSYLLIWQKAGKLVQKKNDFDRYRNLVNLLFSL